MRNLAQTMQDAEQAVYNTARAHVVFSTYGSAKADTRKYGQRFGYMPLLTWRAYSPEGTRDTEPREVCGETLVPETQHGPDTWL